MKDKKKYMKEYCKQYYKNNKTKILRKTKNWANKNPGRRKEIARDYELQKKGWTQERYDAVHKEQKGLCAICTLPVEGVLDADHKHSIPPKPRGLLCHLCNLGLGMFKEDPARLAAAIEYLRKHSDASEENN